MKFKRPLILLLLLCLISIAATFIFTACSDSSTDNSSDGSTDAHIHGYAVDSFIPATCLEQGQTIYKCTRCDDTYIVYSDALGHRYNNSGFCSGCDSQVVDEGSSRGLYYTLMEDGTGYRVQGLVSISGEVVISSTFDGLPVKEIHNYGFAFVFGLTGITIPDNVTYIDEYAFYNCANLESIVIPNSVTSIGEYAFYKCASLTSIIMPDSGIFIGKLAFYGCASLESITIPAGVASIGIGTFDGCTSLKSIIIPDSVAEIIEYAFNDCTGLKEFYYGGTAEQWGKITKQNTGNMDLIGATRYYFSEEYPYNDEVTSGNFWHYVNGEIVIWSKNT